MLDTVIIGGGQAGLAVSAGLAGTSHVVLERGRVGQAWRSRWDSLRLLTPNALTQLPRFAYSGPAPEGFMTKDELVALLDDYARRIQAPVREGVTVTSVQQAEGGFSVETDREVLRAANVVVATGHANAPKIPQALSAAIDPRIPQMHSSEYRNAEQLPPGTVLIVGAGPSGMQLAAELRRAGQAVVLAAGRHGRGVRMYRGRDLFWWLHDSGLAYTPIDEIHDLDRARRSPNLAVSGANGGEDLDLGVLERMGCRVAGHLLQVSRNELRFADDVLELSADADARIDRVLNKIDQHIDAHPHLTSAAPTRPVPVRIDEPVSGWHTMSDIGSVIWATGYRREYPWLHVPVTDADGDIVQEHGVTAVPGLFTIGMHLQSRNFSHNLLGVGRDAQDLARRIRRRSYAPAA